MRAPGRHQAVVMSGGASYGSYEVGVLRALSAGASPATGFAPFEPLTFAGTSTGAFNAAVLTADHRNSLADAAVNLERLWFDDISTAPDRCGNGVIRYRFLPSDTLRPSCWVSSDPLRSLAEDAQQLLTESLKRGVNFLRSDATLGARSLDLFDVQSFISGDPYRNLVTRRLKPSDIRMSWRRLRISATNWLTGEVRVFANDEMSDEQTHNIVLASSAVPGIFPPVSVDGVPFADGGVVMYTPLRPAIDAGAEEIHVISVNPEVSALQIPTMPNTLSTLYRFLAISLAATINRDIEIAKRLNDGVELLEAGKEQPHPDFPSAAVTLALGSLANQAAGSKPYRKLTIHRYQLSGQFDNFFQWFDFELDRIKSLIDRGYRDAVAHDCRANGCVGV